MGQCCGSLPKGKEKPDEAEPPVGIVGVLPPSIPATRDKSPLLNLPVEIFLHVASKLDECSAASLALVNKAAYHLRAQSTLTSVSSSQILRSRFLQLLEKDKNVGSLFFFCDLCAKLHYFQSYWGPEKSWAEFMSISRYRNYKHHVIGLNLLGTSVDISWYHTRLAMNRHLYGPPCGIDIENLSTTTRPQIAGSRQSIHTTKAKIVDNKLIVQVHHVLTPVSPDIPAETFRQDVLNWTLYVCPHTAVGSCINLKPAAIPELQARGGSVVFKRCQGSLSSCKKCNSDFSVTIEIGQDLSGISSAGYRIIVVSYHMIGACRSPWDQDCISLFDWYSTQPRNLKRHPRGSVIKKWDAFRV